MSINASSVIMAASSVAREDYKVSLREVVNFSLPLLVQFCTTFDIHRAKNFLHGIKPLQIDRQFLCLRPSAMVVSEEGQGIGVS
jgi:hypothetical protein